MDAYKLDEAEEVASSMIEAKVSNSWIDSNAQL